MPARVSVVIPTHDRRDLLVRALRSVLAQTHPADEVVVVDDGSADGTAERVRREFPAVRLLRQEHRGVSAARNRGIAAAGGEWVAFLDSDDEWLPGKLERQLAAIAAQPGSRLCHCDEIWIRRGRRVNPGRRHRKRGGWIFRHCLPLCCISPSAALVHRSVFAEVGLFDETLPACEDYDLWLRVTARMPVLLVEEPLVIKHGGHPDQLSRRVAALDRYRIQALEKIVASPDLDAADRRRALETLTGKLAVYRAGAAKRGRAAEAAELDDRLRRHRNHLLEDSRPGEGRRSPVPPDAR